MYKNEVMKMVKINEKINLLKQDINMIIAEFDYHNLKLEKKLKEIKILINKIK